MPENKFKDISLYPTRLFNFPEILKNAVRIFGQIENAPGLTLTPFQLDVKIKDADEIY